MTTPSIKQVQFIKSLCAQRTQALATERWAHLLAKDVATSKDASNLISVLMHQVPQDIDESDEYLALKADIERLRVVAATLPNNDRDFAESLVGQFDRRGRLTDNQVPHVARLLNRADSGDTGEVPAGLYRLGDDIVKVYVTQNNRLGTKVLTITNEGKASFVYTPGLMSRLQDGMRLTAEQARAFGRQYDLCVACGHYLEDDRSLAAGYGPVCASKNGWHYPSQDEAAAILQRERGLVTA
jgi:hypothetical protein